MHRLYLLPQRLFVVALTGALLFTIVPAQASTTLNEMRVAYREADLLLNQKKVNSWLKRKAALKQYPLYHYLILKEVRATHTQYSDSQIDRIISRVDVPLPSGFSRWWLNRILSHKDWNLVLKYFAGSKNTETQCAYALAMLRSKPGEQASPYVEALWLVGRSQPDQCDPLFERALQTGMIDDSLIWQRMLLTSRRNQPKMTAYLSGLLRSKEVKQWGNQLNQVHRNPKSTIKKNLSKWVESSYGRDLIKYGMVRITRKNPKNGAEFWQSLKNRNPDAISRLAETEREIAQILGWRRHKSAYKWLARLPESLQDQSILELMARNALATENWSGVLNSISLMPAAEANRPGWNYWRARALHQNSRHKEAEAILVSLADRRDFYGFLAADQMGLDYNLWQAGKSFDSSNFRSLIKKEPAVARIREWLALRKPYNARRELNHLTNSRNGDSDFWLQASELFHQWGWYDGAIRSAYTSGKHDQIDLSVTYPSPYLNNVRREAIRSSVPEHWIYGIMRQESLFIHDIRSGADAIGLMQLLPSTARRVAQRNGLKRPSRKDLSNASLNIRLGVSYFRSLLDRTKGNPVNSLIGYNAGPKRIKQWKSSIKASDPAMFVESIPFTETRNYIKKILVNFIIYEEIHNSEHTRIRDYLETSDAQLASSTYE